MERRSGVPESKSIVDAPVLYEEIMEASGQADADRLESNRKYGELCKGVVPGANIQLR